MTEGTTRRTFLTWSGTTASAAAYAQLLGPLAERSAGATPDIPSRLPSYALHLRRPDDQCVLTLSFWNIRPDFKQQTPVLTRIDSSKPNLLVVTFGSSTAPAPQHVAEAAYPLKGVLDGSAQKHAPTKKPATSSFGDVPFEARLAGGSRLAFVIPNDAIAPAGKHPLTLDTSTLLNWLGFVLSVTQNAVGSFRLDALGRGPAGLTAPKAPGSTQTSIEMPYGLIISPPAYLGAGVPGPFSGTSVFVNATEPVTHNGWTELWHTRLAARHLVIIGRLGALLVDENDRDLRMIRALWCTDSEFQSDVSKNVVEPSAENPKFTPPAAPSLQYADRYDIVRLSSDFTLAKDGGPYKRTGTSQSGAPLAAPFVPSPATVDRLMLTSLGGWLDCDAHWDLPHHSRAFKYVKKHGKKHKVYTEPPQYNSSLIAWRHRLVQARDCYVRVVRKGYLFPWGHRAALVTVTEREPTVNGTAVGAYLRQKTFIVVGQPSKTYGGPADFAPHSGRRIPFQTVEALTLVTPDLLKPSHYLELKHQNNRDETVFQPMVTKNSPFKFHFRGTDWAGDPIDFRSPVLWIDDTVAYADTAATKKLMQRVMFDWKHRGFPQIDLHNQRVSVAEPRAHGDTQVVITSFELGFDDPFGAGQGDLASASQPAFYPALETALVDMPEAKTASGNAVAQPRFEYEPRRYLVHGFKVKDKHGKPLNKGGVILRRVDTTTRHQITFRGDKSGGAVTPNLGIDGFSREIGPLSASPNALADDIETLAKGVFNPQTVFAGVDAKLLGGLELSAILKQVNFGDDNNDAALQLTSLEKFNPHRIVTTLDWHPTIQDGGPELPPKSGHIFTIFKTASSPDPATDSMDLHAVIVTSLDPKVPSSTTVIGQIRDFELDLFGDSGATYFIRIPFDSLTFHAKSGKKTDVDVQIGGDGIEFKGPLEFVQELATYLNFDGSGLVINTAGSAITAVLTLAIPSIGVGVFALENLAFSAGVAIPYNGDPVRFDFSFCSRENPFQLEIMVFTGGGFVGLGIGADGVELLEFSFDFGLGISIDIGIASGEVSLVGGVYFESEKKANGSQDVSLTAYVKASGGISALGIVSVSVELYLGLTYEDDGGVSSLSGDAEMSISVHVLFFGGTVGFSVHEQFAGSSAPAPAAPAAASRKKLAGVRADTPPPPPPNHFGDVMTQDDWTEYCGAYALIGVGD